MNTAPELLEAAADLIAEKGWTRFYLTAFNGSHCAVGALIVADGGCIVTTPLARDVLRVLAEKVDPNDEILLALGYDAQSRDRGAWPVVARWNNTVAENGKEVVQLFRDTAWELRAADLIEEVGALAADEKELVSA